MKLLLIRLDGLGDTLLTTPLLRALRSAAPDSHVTVVASPRGAVALAGHPGVDDLLAIDMERSTLGEKRALGRRLRAAGFDAGLTATEKVWGYHWLRMSRAPIRAGFWAGATQPLKGLLLGGALTHRIRSPHDGCHEVERLMRLAEPLGIQAAPGPLWLPSPDPGAGRPPGGCRKTSWAVGKVGTPTNVPGKTVPAADRPRAGLGRCPQFFDNHLALHLSDKWMSDGGTRAHLEALARTLAASSPAGMILSAGPAEAGWSADFARAVGAPLLPSGGFASWCAALRGCAALVTMDTGAAHVAAALGVPVVDVFPAEGAAHTVPRWRPWMVPHRVVLRAGPEEAARVEEEICAAARSLLHAD